MKTQNDEIEFLRLSSSRYKGQVEEHFAEGRKENVTIDIRHKKQ